MSFADFETYLQPEWKRLQNQSLRQLFQDDPHRAQQFSLEAAGLHLNYAQQSIDTPLLQAAEDFFEQHHFRQSIQDLFEGKKVNLTENRQAQHTALRQPLPPADMQAEKTLLLEWARRFFAGEVKGATGETITDVVNLGIGGSDLGPRMVVRALQPYHCQAVKVHFVANVDGSDLFETLQTLQASTTLFIVASKSFTTAETLLNASTAKNWLRTHLPQAEDQINSHFIAITQAPEKAKAWGISDNSILTLPESIGGRYSLWSSMGLAICLAVGIECFQALLAGAHQMDQHFLHAPFSKNMPCLLALTAIINQNFRGAQSHAVLVYDQTLELFPAYLQQVDMESNGKSVTCLGEAITYQTGVLTWGGVGTNGQHAFHQLLHQGRLSTPIDFILPLHAHHPFLAHHQALQAHCYGQIQALLQGCDLSTAYAAARKAGLSHEKAQRLAPHQVLPGNKPCNLITFEKLTPSILGALIALYEHKIFMQSLIWNINAFDQWGVELGKRLAGPFLEQLQRQK